MSEQETIERLRNGGYDSVVKATSIQDLQNRINETLEEHRKRCEDFMWSKTPKSLIFFMQKIKKPRVIDKLAMRIYVKLAGFSKATVVPRLENNVFYFEDRFFKQGKLIGEVKTQIVIAKT